MLPELLKTNLPFRQWKTWNIPDTNLTLIGYSRSNDKTYFHIPKLKCCLDAGICGGRQEDHVFVTHTHVDHIADIAYLSTKKTGVDIYVPEQASEYILRHIEAYFELNNVAKLDDNYQSRFRLHGVKKDDEFVFGDKQNHLVRIIECSHKIPCVGYGLWEKKKRLKTEFQELKEKMQQENKMQEFGKILAEKRNNKVEIEEEYLSPILAFLGDTDISVFAKNPSLFEYPIVITECTFLYDTEKERATNAGHTVWSDLKPIVEAHPQITFVLIHFSLRYSDHEVIEFFREQVDNSSGKLANLVIWASESLLPEQHQSRDGNYSALE